MFLALSKRRQEIITMGKTISDQHRSVLKKYNIELLDQMISVITGSVLLSYMLYCVSDKTIKNFNTDKLIYTFPFVLYGIFRYLYLIYKRNLGDQPEKALFMDPPIIINVLLWVIACVIIIY